MWTHPDCRALAAPPLGDGDVDAFLITAPTSPDQLIVKSFKWIFLQSSTVFHHRSERRDVNMGASASSFLQPPCG